MDGAQDTWGTLQIQIRFIRQSRHTTPATLERNKQLEFKLKKDIGI